MENASNALLIAGAVLLAILIIAVGITLYNKYEGTAQQYEKRMDAVELNRYNTNFEVFEGRKDITAQDIVTLVNFVKNNNEYTSYPNAEIKVDGNDIANTINFLQNNVGQKFKCDKIEKNDYGQVNGISFSKVTT